ncbi:WD40 repeat-like protein [Microthyrium microscopicum]|uniref:WD40 repeat-like protein n=1 Tax=Microthyrium microscopicum TaxID=703497 RepID=A0A6A6UJ62_9PEZI|nr:WD40 repeat-like protein [Microthyrium microscopicum]
MSSAQYELSPPPSDVISAIRFAPNSSRLLVSSWDKNVYLYDVRAPAAEQLVRKYSLSAPVLDVCFGDDESHAYTASLDWTVRRINLETGEDTVLSTHKAGANCVAYSAKTDLLVSASWDGQLHVHALSKPGQPPAVIQLPAKPFSISVTSDKLVVGMANRLVDIYDLKPLEKLAMQHNAGTPQTVEPLQRRESSMKFMTRAIACMPSELGYASSSIEGRVSVEWFDPSDEAQAKKYAFKCHRETVDGIDVVYPVNALAYHSVHKATFASGGGDGHVALWDGATKRRIRQYQKFPSSIAALAFSPNGRYLAVAYSPGFEDGKEDMAGPVGVAIRELSENETKGKGAK